MKIKDNFVKKCFLSNIDTKSLSVIMEITNSFVNVRGCVYKQYKNESI